MPEADLGLERRTADYAAANNRWGIFDWKIKIWTNGTIKEGHDLTRRVRVQAPLGYVPPMTLRPQEPAMKEDPMAELDRTLGMVERFSKAFGGGNGGGGKADAVLLESIKSAAKMEGRFEAEERARVERRDMEERHEKALKEVREEAFQRGRKEAEQEAELKYQKQIMELERQVEGETEPSLIAELVENLGGPESFQKIVGAVATNINRQPTAPSQRHASPPATRRQSAPNPTPTAQAQPVRVNPEPAPAPATQEKHPDAMVEPTRRERDEAVAMLCEAIDALDEGLDSGEVEASLREQTESLREGLASFLGEGEEEGSLAVWWHTWGLSWKPIVEKLLAMSESETPEEEEEMDPETLETLRKLLMERLDGDTPDDAILVEAQEKLGPEGWAMAKKHLGRWPLAMAAGAIGQGQNFDRLRGLLEKFRAA